MTLQLPFTAKEGMEPGTIMFHRVDFFKQILIVQRFVKKCNQLLNFPRKKYRIRQIIRRSTYRIRYIKEVQDQVYYKEKYRIMQIIGRSIGPGRFQREVQDQVDFNKKYRIRQIILRSKGSDRIQGKVQDQVYYRKKYRIRKIIG